MTKIEEAIARLKAIQDKFQAAPEGKLPGDQTASLFREFSDGVIAALAAQKPVTRRMQFGDAKTDAIAALPRDVQKQIDNAVILGTLLRKPANETRYFKRLVSEVAELKGSAFNTSDTDQGGDWVPTGMSPALVEEVTQMGMIEQMHPHISMPTASYDLPIQIGRATAYKATQQTEDTSQTALTFSASDNVTDKTTLTAVDLAVQVLVSKHAEEDAIVPILNVLRNEIVMALKRGVEECCINGDDTATHMDTDIEAAGATDRRTLWKGYRRHGLTNYSINMQGSGNGFDFETFMKVRAKHGKYGINPADLFWLLSLSGFFKALSLKDSNGNPVVTTMDKLGANATAITGVLGKLAGSDIAVSEFSRDDLNSSGVDDGGSDTLSSILSVQKSGFIFGDRRDASIQLLSELYAPYQQDSLLAVIRKAFAPLRPIASHAAVAIGYNVNLA